MTKGAWVTLATNDSYSLGALVLAHSLKRAQSAYPAIVLVTPSVTEIMRDRLSSVFAEVITVDILDSGDAAHLALLARPELGITFTKIHCWNQIQYEKCVFLDADTLVLQNSDELFEREELSASPDVGWPDCFNSGVFVFKPSKETFDALLKFAQERGSFDGGDQGLLNSFFSNWSQGDSNKRLPFTYNVTSVAFYSYLPALKQFGDDIKIMHFIGNMKPWLQKYDWSNRSVHASGHLEAPLSYWWELFTSQVHPYLEESMSGLASTFSKLKTDPNAADEISRRQGWEAGSMDYMGQDSFDNIWAKISETLAKKDQTVKRESPEKIVAKSEEKQEDTESSAKSLESLGEVKHEDIRVTNDQENSSPDIESNLAAPVESLKQLQDITLQTNESELVFPSHETFDSQTITLPPVQTNFLASQNLQETNEPVILQTVDSSKSDQETSQKTPECPPAAPSIIETVDAPIDAVTPKIKSSAENQKADLVVDAQDLASSACETIETASVCKKSEVTPESDVLLTAAIQEEDKKGQESVTAHQTSASSKTPEINTPKPDASVAVCHSSTAKQCEFKPVEANVPLDQTDATSDESGQVSSVTTIKENVVPTTLTEAINKANKEPEMLLETKEETTKQDPASLSPPLVTSSASNKTPTDSSTADKKLDERRLRPTSREALESPDSELEDAAVLAHLIVSAELAATSVSARYNFSPPPVTSQTETVLGKPKKGKKLPTPSQPQSPPVPPPRNRDKKLKKK